MCLLWEMESNNGNLGVFTDSLVYILFFSFLSQNSVLKVAIIFPKSTCSDIMIVNIYNFMGVWIVGQMYSDTGGWIKHLTLTSVEKDPVLKYKMELK